MCMGGDIYSTAVGFGEAQAILSGSGVSLQMHSSYPSRN